MRRVRTRREAIFGELVFTFALVWVQQGHSPYEATEVLNKHTFDPVVFGSNRIRRVRRNQHIRKVPHCPSAGLNLEHVERRALDTSRFQTFVHGAFVGHLTEGNVDDDGAGFKCVDLSLIDEVLVGTATMGDPAVSPPLFPDALYYSGTSHLYVR